MVEFVNTGNEEFIDEDPIGTVADNLTIDSPDSLVQTLLDQNGVTSSDGIAEVRKRLELFRKPQILTTPQALKLVVELSEEALKSRQQTWFQPREKGFRGGYCDFATGITAVVAEQLGMKADLMRVQDLNLMRNIPKGESFSHAFVILTDSRGKRFLTDISFCQFVDPFTGKVHRGVRTAPTDPVGGELADRFIMPGYVRLTDETLNEYLRLLTARKEPVDQMAVNTILDHAPRLDLGITRSEVLKHIDVARINREEQDARRPLQRYSPFRLLFKK